MNPRIPFPLQHISAHGFACLARAAHRKCRGGKFPFILAVNAVDSLPITTRTRGFAECVSPPSFWRHPPLWPLRAASTTPIRPRTMPRCAPLAVPQPALSSQVRPAAAKPKVRLSGLWRAASLAGLRACLPVTDQRQTTRLTSAPFRGVTTSRIIRANRPVGPFFILRHGRDVI